MPTEVLIDNTDTVLTADIAGKTVRVLARGRAVVLTLPPAAAMNPADTWHVERDAASSHAVVIRCNPADPDQPEVVLDGVSFAAWDFQLEWREA